MESYRLSHLALRTLRSTKGVTAVLVGMRQVSYVEDVLQELHCPCVVEDRKSSWEKNYLFPRWPLPNRGEVVIGGTGV